MNLFRATVQNLVKLRLNDTVIIGGRKLGNHFNRSSQLEFQLRNMKKWWMSDPTGRSNDMPLYPPSEESGKAHRSEETT
jgi:hypothetical protein